MPLRTADVGMCPATLVVDPFRATDEMFEEVATASAAAGFDAFSLWSFWPAAYGAARARALLDGLGISVPVVEAATRWPHGSEAALDEAAALVELATALGAHTLATCALEPTLESWDDARSGFRTLCDAAEAAGLRVCIEFLPFTAVPDLATAWRIVEASEAANAGILLDMMHWHRASDGPELDTLRAIPGERIHYVQVCDTVTASGTSDDYMREAISDRRLLGEGDVDVATLLGALDEIGADPWFAHEVFSHRLASDGAAAMARRLAATTVDPRRR